jgi:hypothetical protein
LLPNHLRPGFSAGLRKAVATYSSWLQQALAEPAKPLIEDHSICGSHSPECLDHLTTQFIRMTINDDQDMTNTLEDWEHAEDDEPILDLNLVEYDKFLLDNLELEGELPKEEGI